MANNDEFLEQNKDFVLKLKLVGLEGPPQIRRVRLPRIAVEGKVSYEELVGLAVQYTFPDAVDGGGYQATLTYYDVDNDCVIIGCTEELVDAIDQFSQQRVLRITTDVKESSVKSVKKEKQKTEQPAEAKDQAEASKISASTTDTNTSGTPSPVDVHDDMKLGPKQLRNALESVAALASSIMALHPDSPAMQAAATTPVPPVPPAPTAAPVPIPVVVPAPRENSAESVATTLTTAPSLKRDDIVEKSVADEKGAEKETEAGGAEILPSASEEPAAREPPAPKPAPKTESSEQGRPFIHGRHTCDACRCTPIVGLRYHATNMADYDLCANCKESYKGDEIKFEVVELDRDRPFQDRWHRRRAKWERQLKQPVSKSSGCRSNWNSSHRHNSGSFGSLRHSRRGPYGPHHRAARHGLSSNQQGPFCAARQPPVQPPTNFNEALQEAIRRSLEDVAEKPADEPKVEAETTGHPKQTANIPKASDPLEVELASIPTPKVTEATRPEAEPEELTTQEKAGVDETPEQPKAEEKVDSTKQTEAELEEAVAEPMQTEAVQTETPKANIASFDEVLEDERQAGAESVQSEPEQTDAAAEPVGIPTEDECARTTETSVKPVLTVDDSTEGAAEVPCAVSVENKAGASASSSREGEEETTCEQAGSSKVPGLEIDENLEAPFLAEMENHKDDFTVSTMGELDVAFFPKTRAKSATSPGGLSEDSFLSDAAGNGDVAQALGETFDKFANEINAMVSELDREHEAGEAGSDAVAGACGATILDSAPGANQNDDATVDDTEDGWQVVAENDQVAADEMIARAAQMIGSALFNSEMSRSGGAVSALTASGHSVSSATSVPSTVATFSKSVSNESHISAALIARWGKQLQQLRELGFHNEAACIDVLERLNAANIGVGSSDEVSVTQVVNELLKHN